ncbi:acyltransferase [Bifidobacterium saguini DSM 23967]|uniref:Acyltransferase n=2 Tax=Bifidobacterium saguini TaxID=762210 RepID=A0A087DBB5_9BIFI|nr:acyltransferase domain-containing protein [Bifidobacterium saguini]KFI92815.1 acyltransferase [Bifidobacterium saguini DSM 23967]QTB91812.1 DUF5596 domain-containing protein [Bifidobacterium saguini]
MAMDNICDYALCERYFGMKRSMYDSAVKVLEWLRADQVGSVALAQLDDVVIRRNNVPAAAALVERLRAHAGTFYLPNLQQGEDMALAAVLVDLLPKAIDMLHDLGIPDPVLQATLHDFAIWADVYQEKTGREGINETEWNLLFLTGRILRIGRLQYESFTFLEPYYVYRSRYSGDFVVLVSSDVRVSADGIPLASAAPDSQEQFVTQLHSDGVTVTGNVADTVTGTIRREQVSLALAGYELVLAPGMPATNMHIPADGPLIPGSVDESIAQAVPLLTSLGRCTPVAVCESWLLDPALVSIAHPESNICHFMHRFAKFPNPRPGSAIVERVCGWGADRLPVDELPERTSLQRGLKQYLLAGGTVRDVSGVVPLTMPTQKEKD